MLDFIKRNKQEKVRFLDEDVTSIVKYNNESVINDSTPLLTKEVVKHLYRVDNRIYNKQVLDNRNALFKCEDNIYNDNYVYAYNYENQQYKYTQCHLLMWFCSDRPLYLFRLNPFTFPFYIKLLSSLQSTNKIV